MDSMYSATAIRVHPCRKQSYRAAKKLQSLPGITDIKPLESNAYPEKYVLFIEQLLDPKHPEAGSFKQRIILGHIGFDRPTILVTEGYAATYALAPRYQEELSKRLNANLVFVEYRYFDASTPDPCNWDYLTVENSLYDLHHVTTTFKQLYPQNGFRQESVKEGKPPCSIVPTSLTMLISPFLM